MNRPRETPNGSSSLCPKRAPQLEVLQITAIDFYEELQVNQMDLHLSLPPKGLVDGGAMASTLNHLDYMFQYRDFSNNELGCVPLLCVTNDTTHCPRGMGYLCIPTSGTKQHVELECYYTPEIPAMIVSPDAIGKYLGCQGYQTYSDF